MFNRNDKNNDTEDGLQKKLDPELSEVELAKVAGGMPPRAGGSGMEI